MNESNPSFGRCQYSDADRRSAVAYELHTTSFTGKNKHELERSLIVRFFYGVCGNDGSMQLSQVTGYGRWDGRDEWLIIYHKWHKLFRSAVIAPSTAGLADLPTIAWGLGVGLR